MAADQIQTTEAARLVLGGVGVATHAQRVLGLGEERVLVLVARLHKLDWAQVLARANSRVSRQSVTSLLGVRLGLVGLQGRRDRVGCSLERVTNVLGAVGCRLVPDAGNELENVRGLLGVGLHGGTSLVGERLTSSLRHDC